MAHVISIEEVMPGVFLLWLEALEIAAQARPGQFLMVHCQEGLSLRRAFSVHQVGENGRLALLMKVVGLGSRWLSQRLPSDLVDILGPLGNGFTVTLGAKLLLVAGGMGIAPLVFMAQRAISQGHQVTLIHGTATAKELYPSNRLPQGVRFEAVTEDGSQGRRGLVTDLLPELASQADQILACGPSGMYRTLAEFIHSRPIQVSLEAWLGCGLGACYACTTFTRQGPQQVCRDGPVFDLRDLVWEKKPLP